MGKPAFARRTCNLDQCFAFDSVKVLSWIHQVCEQKRQPNGRRPRQQRTSIAKIRRIESDSMYGKTSQSEHITDGSDPN